MELSAPTPWLIQATEQDYFTPARRPSSSTTRQGAGIGLYGAEDKVAFFVGPGPHGTPLVSREAVYQWLIRWLNDGQGDYHEQQVKIYTELRPAGDEDGRVED